MKRTYLTITKAFTTIIAFIILFSACSVEENNNPYVDYEYIGGDLLEESVKLIDKSANYEYLEPDCSIADILAYIAPVVFEYIAHTPPLGLRPEIGYDERFYEIFGARHGYTYFDFIGDGTYSLVAFRNGPNPLGGPSFSIGWDSAVYAKIDGEWQQVWFFSTQLALDLVMPGSIAYNYRDTPVLLVVGRDVGDIIHIRLVMLKEGELRVFNINANDPRPDWYWRWREAGSPMD